MLVRITTAFRRVGRVLPLLACAVLPAAALAARQVPVFTVDVAAQNTTALQQAMRAALVRATGHASAATDPQLAALVAQASQYVQHYEHTASGQLQVTFNGPAVDQAIEAAGRSLWNANRPFTLIVLSPPPASSAQQSADATAVQSAAEARGLPISIVPLHVRDTKAHLLPAATLLAMAHSLGAEQLLIGRDLGSPQPSNPSTSQSPAPAPAVASPMAASGPSGASASAAPAPADRWRWTLVTPFITRHFTGGIAAGIDRTVEFLAPPAQASAGGHPAKVSVRIEGLRTLDQYAHVETMLAAVPGVQRSVVAHVSGTAVVFDLWARGGSSTVSRLLGISPHFESVSTSRTLAYRYVPAPPARAASSGASGASTTAAQSAASTDKPAAPPP